MVLLVFLFRFLRQQVNPPSVLKINVTSPPGTPTLTPIFPPVDNPPVPVVSLAVAVHVVEQITCVTGETCVLTVSYIHVAASVTKRIICQYNSRHSNYAANKVVLY